MNRQILLTYRNRDEFEKIYQELQNTGKDIKPFIFEETRKLIDESEGNTIDITLLIKSIEKNEENKLPAMNNLINLNNQNRIIIKEDLADQALDFFSIIFSSHQPVFESKSTNLEEELKHNRTILYFYRNSAHLNRIIELSTEKKIPFFSFSQINNKSTIEIARLIRNSQKKILIDISTAVRAGISSNATILFLVEQFINNFEDAYYLLSQDLVDEALDNFQLFFEKSEDIYSIFPELSIEPLEQNEEAVICKITDTKLTEISTFQNFLQTNLIGHAYFKERFLQSVKNFIQLNKIGQKKILSIFILGKSGLGKTEVSRIIKNYLEPDTSLVKINFGNYSSKDALNSLIGSPAGYVGCESGELGIKIQKSKAAIILCDEFEKCTHPIFNFFLELLEDGSFTDSLTREYNLDGYIIIFTSNLTSISDFKKIIPAEFQSRLDLICEFEPLSYNEKEDYVRYQIDKYINELQNKYPEISLNDQKERIFNEITLSDTDNLRDIKRMIEQNIIEKCNIP